MTPFLVTAVLTALAAVVVVLTRVRLATNRKAAGRPSIPPAVLTVHTVAGGLAAAVWVWFLVTGNRWAGGLALLGWWVTAGAGLLTLSRWLPAKGRHSSTPQAHSVSQGPALSVLAHGGLLVAVAVFTVLFLTVRIR